MNPSHSNPFLRRVLKIQAVMELTTGAVTMADSGWLATNLQLPRELLLSVGGMALLFGAFIYYVATRPQLSAKGVWSIIGINAAWAIECVVALTGGWLTPNTFGSAVIIGNVIEALVLAELEFIALRRTRVMVGATA